MGEIIEKVMINKMDQRKHRKTVGKKLVKSEMHVKKREIADRKNCRA